MLRYCFCFKSTVLCCTSATCPACFDAALHVTLVITSTTGSIPHFEFQRSQQIRPLLFVLSFHLTEIQEALKSQIEQICTLAMICLMTKVESPLGMHHSSCVKEVTCLPSSLRGDVHTINMLFPHSYVFNRHFSIYTRNAYLQLPWLPESHPLLSR